MQPIPVITTRLSFITLFVACSEPFLHSPLPARKPYHHQTFGFFPQRGRWQDRPQCGQIAIFSLPRSSQVVRHRSQTKRERLPRLSSLKCAKREIHPKSPTSTNDPITITMQYSMKLSSIMLVLPIDLTGEPAETLFAFRKTQPAQPVLERYHAGVRFFPRHYARHHSPLAVHF